MKKVEKFGIREAKKRTKRERTIGLGLLILIFCLALVPGAQAADVAIVGSWTSESLYETNGFTYTPGAGNNRVALIMFTGESSGGQMSVSSVTLGGQTLTAIETAAGVIAGDNPGAYHNIIWLGYLDESEIGAMSGTTLTINWGTAPDSPYGEIKVQAATYANVDQTTPIGDSSSLCCIQSASAITAPNLNTGLGDQVAYVTVIGQPYTHTADTGDGGYTEEIEIVGPSNDHSQASATRDIQTAATVSPTATWDTANRVAIIVASIQRIQDFIPPTLTLASPTPGNETITATYTYINITADEVLSQALLEWDGVNETMSGSGTNWYINKTGLYNGNYTFRVWGSDEADNWNVTEMREVNISYTTTLAGDITDDAPLAITCNVTTYDQNNNHVATTTDSSFNWAGVQSGWYVQFNCSTKESVIAKFRINGDASSVIVRLNNNGASNPVGSEPTGTAIQYNNVSAYGLSFASVEVTINYSDSGLTGSAENLLGMQHYIGAAWNILSSTLDTTANTVTATTTSLSPFGVTYSTPPGTGNYKGSDLPPEVEMTNVTKSCGFNSAGGQTCHLYTHSWPTETADGVATAYDHPHPGENRGPAGFFPLWVHRHHGGDNWPHWAYINEYVTAETTDPAVDNYGVLYTTVQDGQSDATLGSGNDIAIVRHRARADYGTAYVHEPFKGNHRGDQSPDGSSAINDDYPMASCSWADTYDGFGCHGIIDNPAFAETFAPDGPRTDSITCTVCHNESGTGTLAINHGQKTDCGECHLGSAGTVLSGNNPDTTSTNYCDSTACHTQITTAGLRNATQLHAGVDCRFCHGHAHNVSEYYTDDGTWNVTCGSSNDVCHGTGADEPRNVGPVNHNVTGADTGPDCDDCHTSQTGVGKGHNITIPTCSKCHNSTSTWNAAATNTTIPAWQDETHLSTIGANATHGHSLGYGGRGDYTNLSCKFCHNSTSYHSSPGLLYGTGGDYDNCNNTACHGTGGAGHTVTTTHSNVSCAACHNNDTITSASSDGAVPLGTNIHASNSSWMIPFNITADNVTKAQCLMCHSNSTTIDPTLECSKCHDTSEIHSPYMGFDGVIVDNNHTLPGPNCVYCHDSAGSGPAPASAKVNVSKLNATGATHRDVNNETDPSGDWTNRMCWACHANDSLRADNKVEESELPIKDHPQAYKNATCRYCHDNVTRLMNYSHHNQSYVEENYYKNFTTFNASAHARGNISSISGTVFYEMVCWDCHDKHAATPQNCEQCHDNRTRLQSLDASITPTISELIFQNYTNFNSSAHRHGNLTNHGLMDVNLVTFDCWDCHSSHTVSLTRCDVCHGNETLMNDTYITGTAWEGNASVLSYLYKNNTPYETSAHGSGNITAYPGLTFWEMECWDCHDAHAVAPQDCFDCHDNQTHLQGLYDTINASVAAALYQNRTLYNNSAHGIGNLSGTGLTDVGLLQFECQGCHDSHAVAPQDCNDCHGNETLMNDTYITGTAWEGNASVLAYLYKNATIYDASAHGSGNITAYPGLTFYQMECYDCHEAHAVSPQDCQDCHDNQTALQALDSSINTSVAAALYQNRTLFNNSAHGTGNLTNHGLSDVNLVEFECQGCHDSHAVAPQDCNDCHGNQTLMNDTYITGTAWEGNASVLAYLYKNATTYDASAHGSGNITGTGLTDVNLVTLECYGCHDSHAVAPQECQDCHGNRTLMNDTYINGSSWQGNETLLTYLYKNYTTYNLSAHGNGTISAFPGQSFFQMKCQDCHDSHAATPQECQDCHDNQTALQALDSSINATVAAALYKNYTAYNASSHARGEIGDYPGLTFYEMTCIDCHDSHAATPQECRDCHDNQTALQALDTSINASVAAALYKNYTTYNASSHGSGNLTATGLEDVNLVTYDCQDCHSSHEVTASPCQNCHDNRTWIDNLVTAQIGANDTVLEYLYQNYTALGQGLHGSGVECDNCHNAHNVASVADCADCHTNKTGGYDPATGVGNFSAPIVIEHLNSTDTGYQAATVNVSVNTTAQCWECHNNSVLTAASNDLKSLSVKANVSHYLTNTSLNPGGYNTTNCTTCHKNTTIATEWYLPQGDYVNQAIRHGEDNAAFCGKCHNSTNAADFHKKDVYLPFYVHKEYDWEDDDDNEDKWGAGNGTGWKRESCFACHNTSDPENSDPYPRRTCEDCHLNGSIGPYNRTAEGQFFLRSDWQESIPLVYEHIFENAPYTNTTGDIVNVTGVEVSTSNVSELIEVPPLPPDPSLRNSTCMGWSNDTQAGVCHGVPSSNTSDGYYAFSNKSADFDLTDAPYYPYYYNAPVDWLPDTKNCTYCHTGNASVMWQWGNATNITASTKRNHTAIDTASMSKCWECHVNASEPFNFHSIELNRGVGGPDCVGCHDTGKSYAPDVDVSKMNASTSVHKNLNNATANTTILTDPVDKACWACHGDGTQPVSHPSGYNTPKECPDCHTNATGGYNASSGKGNYSAPFIFEHNPYSTGDVTTTAQCWDCHNNSVATNADAENGTTINNSRKSNISHYGITSSLVNTTNCTDCHKVASNAAKWGGATQVSASMGTTNANCYLCHMDTVNVAPKTSIGFHEGNVTEWNWNSCDECHYTGGRRS